MNTVTILCTNKNLLGIPGQKEQCAGCACELFVGHSALNAIPKERLRTHDIEFMCLDCLSEEQWRELGQS